MTRRILFPPTIGIMIGPLLLALFLVAAFTPALALEKTADWTLETGHVIAIQHKNNLISAYKHCSVLLKKQGDLAKAGDPIAISGESGELVTGPHLHFELWYNGSAIDPEEYIIFN